MPVLMLEINQWECDIWFEKLSFAYHLCPVFPYVRSHYHRIMFKVNIGHDPHKKHFRGSL